MIWTLGSGAGARRPQPMHLWCCCATKPALAPATYHLENDVFLRDGPWSVASNYIYLEIIATMKFSRPESLRGSPAPRSPWTWSCAHLRCQMQRYAQELMDLFEDVTRQHVLPVWASDILPSTRAVETVFMVSN